MAKKRLTASLRTAESLQKTGVVCVRECPRGASPAPPTGGWTTTTAIHPCRFSSTEATRFIIETMEGQPPSRPAAPGVRLIPAPPHPPTPATEGGPTSREVKEEKQASTCFSGRGASWKLALLYE